VLEDEIVVALNKIRDNIWLGDLSEIQRIAKDILDSEESTELSKQADRAHEIVLKLRRDGRGRTRRGGGLPLQ